MLFDFRFLAVLVIGYSLFGSSVGTLPQYSLACLFCLPSLGVISLANIRISRIAFSLILFLFCSASVGFLNLFYNQLPINKYLFFFFSDVSTILFILVPIVFLSRSSLPKPEFFHGVVGISSFMLCLRFFTFFSNIFSQVSPANPLFNFKGAIHIYADPIVLLSASLFIPYLFYCSYKPFSLSYLFCAISSFVSLTTLVITGSRTVILVSALVSAVYFYSYGLPWRQYICQLRNLNLKFNFLLFILFIMIVFWLSTPILADAYYLLLDKTYTVFLNSRDQELSYVLQSLDSNFLDIFFGNGLGSSIIVSYKNSPIPYTHSVITYLLMKGGLFGLFLGFYFSLRLAFQRFLARQKSSLSIGYNFLGNASLIVLFVSYLCSTAYRCPDVQLLWFLAVI